MMNYDKFVFEIPIYRLSEKEFYEELNQQTIKRSKPIELFKELFDEETYEKKYEEHLEGMKSINRYLWEYNEIVGWIGIFFFFSDVRAEYYIINAKRMRKGIRRKIDWMGKFFEIHLDGTENSNQIFELISLEIEREKKIKPFKKRYLDLSKFNKIGKHVDWLGLMKEHI